MDKNDNLRESEIPTPLLPQDPIFIVGNPRSGTTLVQALLATQKNIYSLPETHFFTLVRKVIRTDRRGFIEPDCIEPISAELLKRMDLRLTPTEIGQLIHWTELKKINLKNLFEYIVHYYIRKDTGDKTRYRWMEKTPEHAFQLEDIHSLYPEAQFVNVLRHPVPAVCSVKINFTFNKEREWQWYSKRWKRNLECTEAFALKHPGKIYTLKYEDLTEEPESELKKLCGFLGIPLDWSLIQKHSDIVEDFILPSEIWKKTNNHRNISNTNRKYESLISKEDAGVIETILKDKMNTYGYRPFFSAKSCQCVKREKPVGKKILVVSGTPTHPRRAGNRERLYTLLKSLQDAGHTIHFMNIAKEANIDETAMRACWDDYYKIPYSRPPKKEGIPTLFNKIKARITRTAPPEKYVPYEIDDWYDPAISDFIRNDLAGETFDVIMVLYVFFSKALTEFDSNVLKILETQDVFTNRHKQFIKRKMKPNFFYTTRKEETKGVNRADVILAIQDKEKAFYEKISRKKVATIGHLLTLKNTPRRIIPGETIRLLFVASENRFNVDGLNFFLAEVYPELKTVIPKIEINVVGRICRKLDNPIAGCRIVGEVEELYSQYEAADIVINPVRMGTGLNIKTIEALGYGRPLVTTPHGAAGLEPEIGKAFLVADKPREFVEHIKKLCTEPRYYETIAGQAFEFAEKYNNKHIALLRDIIEKTE